jgi:hypothetical protein
VSKRIDHTAVDCFAIALRQKMDASRKKGRNGWHDPALCPASMLADHFIEHIWKGNAGTFEDLAAYLMMLHQRGEDPKVLVEAAQRKQALLLRGLEDVVYNKTRLSEAEELLQDVVNNCARQDRHSIKDFFEKYGIALRPEEDEEEYVPDCKTDGAMAFRNGMNQLANPYELMSEYSDLWLQGWAEAEENCRKPVE